MIVVKAFEKGLKCRGYQYKVGLNTCTQAKCFRDGFHCAEDPLDCLNYYTSFADSEFWLCDAGGDLDEDGTDSKISCTKLTIIRRLDLLGYVLMCLRYLMAHADRPRNHRVCRNTGEVQNNSFVIVEGDSGEAELTARGLADGDILGFHDTHDNTMYVVLVNGEDMVGKWYNRFGQEVNPV